MKDSHLLRVFTDKKGDFGDRASVVVDEGRSVSDADRHDMTRMLDTGETIFINNLDTLPPWNLVELNSADK